MFVHVQDETVDCTDSVHKKTQLKFELGWTETLYGL